jgi:ABC-type nitrate/sulfonate/bicarbonate transport system substrate-binding protein
MSSQHSPARKHSPRKSLRAVLITVAAAATVVTLAGCGSATPAASSAKANYGQINVQLSWIKNSEFAGEFYAESKGYYKDAGFSSVDLTAGPAATEALVLSGAALVGLSNPVSVAPVILQEGGPLKIIGTTYQKNPFSIISLKSGANILTPKDLIGKKIGVQAGGNETLFQALLKVNHIDPSKVTTVPVQYDPSPLVNGGIDGYFGYVTNEAITLEADGHPVSNLLFADNGLPFVAESFIVTQKSIDTKRAELEAFLYAEIRGWKDALANTTGGAKLAVDTYGKTLNLDLAKETAQAKSQNDLLITSTDTQKSGLFTMSDTLIKQNLASLAASGYTISSSKLFDFSLLKDVYAKHPELLK